MKVRDLREYTRALCKGHETIELLGTDKEEFLKIMNGQMKTVRGLITGAASFASNAEEQLFYEFVQNAYDANADSLFFFANKEYLIVLNNGDPFYTDFDFFDSNTRRDGNLYSFLAKGQSEKLEDDSKMGKYGQGSKLLYTLLADVDYQAKTEDLLYEAIKNKKKGPYLISWNDKAQLDAILINGDNWTPAKGDDYVNNILFAKILMSYYPIAPSQYPEFFTNEEAQSAIKAFDKLVDPRRNMHFLNKGTALIIPLGKGKYEAIISEKNLENVRTRLGGYASLSGDQERNTGKKLSHIYVMGEEIEQHEVKSILIEYDIDGRTFNYHFAFNPVFAEKGYVNFFKGLPILQTKYNLGFIIDSQIFDVDDSRQRISDTVKAENQLKIAYKHLIDELENLYHSDRAVFDYIYKAIIASNFKSDDEKNYVRDSFYEAFRPFMLKYTLTSDNNYEDYSNVYMPAEEEQIDSICLSTLGIKYKHWFNKDVLSAYKRHFKGRAINILSLNEIILESDKNKLQEWILKLSVEEYARYQSLFVKCTDVEEVKLFRSNKNLLYSVNDIYSSSHIFYSDEQMFDLTKALEHIICPFEGEMDEEDFDWIVDKVEENVEVLRSNNISKEACCNILCYIVNEDSEFEDRIREDIALFQNFRGEYLALSALLSDRPEGTILFDEFRIKGHIPESLKKSGLLVEPEANNSEIWFWVRNNIPAISEVEGWGENTMRYLQDIKSVYEQSGITDRSLRIPFYIDYQGMPSDEECYTVSNIDELTQDEYEDICSTFSDFNLVPYEYEDILTTAPFTLDSCSASDLIRNGVRISKATVRTLVKMSTNFLWDFKMSDCGGTYEISPINFGKNYINDVTPELSKSLADISMYHIPNGLQDVFSGQNMKSYDFKSNPDLIKRAIDKIYDRQLLFSLVKGCNEEVITYYFNKLPALIINDSIAEDDVRWEIIKFAASRNTEENEFKEIVFKKIRHQGNPLPETITDNLFEMFGHQYDLYKLDDGLKLDNSQFNSFLECLPTEGCAEYFKKEYYSDRLQEQDLDDLFDTLKDEYLDVEKLRFCLDCCINGDKSHDNLEIGDEVPLSDALDMIKANSYSGFDDYFKIEDFDYEVQVYAEAKWLTEDELLPKDLKQWIDKNPDAVNLFADLLTEEDPFIAARIAVDENIDASVRLPEFDEDNSTRYKYTLEWLLSKNKQYIHRTPAYEIVFRILESLPEEWEDIALLRYSSVEPVKEHDLSIRPVFTLEQYQDSSFFLCTDTWQQTFLDMLLYNTGFRKTFDKYTVYAYRQVDFLSKWKLHNCPKVDVSVKANSGNYKELDSAPYNKWKTMPESKGIKIFTSKNPIGISFTLKSGNTELFTKGLEDREYGFDVMKMVVVKHPNAEKLSPLKVIEKNIADMSFFKEPFIYLQGLYVEQMERLEEHAMEMGTDIEEVIASTAKNSGNKDSKKEKDANIHVDEDKLESVKEILDAFNADELQEIADQKDKLLEVLNDFNAAEDETKESKVRQTIGYIGELIYKLYLESKGKTFTHSAVEGVGEYDFHNETDHTYIDIKTTIYSLKDGTAPFYLHRSQNVFMQKHPDEKYRVVRISLTDLGLKQTYERLRDTYGPEANPLENPRLEAECQKVAKKYWNKAKIEEFDAVSPEYAIRIEKK